MKLRKRAKTMIYMLQYIEIKSATIRTVLCAICVQIKFAVIISAASMHQQYTLFGEKYTNLPFDWPKNYYVNKSLPT